jgi:type II secretory pathway pseudopilin PulG
MRLVVVMMIIVMVAMMAMWGWRRRERLSIV